MELWSDTDKFEEGRDIGCSLFVEVAWDERNEWNHEFCAHMDYCLVDLHTKSYKIEASRLLLVDGDGAVIGTIKSLVPDEVSLKIANNKKAQGVTPRLSASSLKLVVTSRSE